MELAQDKLDLIEKIIRSDRKFVNNEDLYDDFFNETCKRSFLIVNTVTSNETLEAYLRKIVTTSILNVLKSEGRLRRTRSGYMSTNEVPLESSVTETVPDYSKIQISYGPVEIQETPEDIVIKKEQIFLLNFKTKSNDDEENEEKDVPNYSYEKLPTEIDKNVNSDSGDS